MRKICLDAGHYGKYNRSPAVPSYFEGDRMWVLYNKLTAALKKRGVQVIRTRSILASDMALTTRGRMAQGCDLFLSLHSNAVGSRIDENVDYPLACVPLTGKGNDLGQKLADCVARTMDTRQPGRIATRRGSTGGEYYGVIRGAAAVGVPGIILEHSFHTNTRATRWLLSDDNLALLAEKEAECICAWLDTQTPTQPDSSPSIDDARRRNTVYRKTWRVKVDSADRLNMRTGAGTDKPVLAQLKSGASFHCYGYYNTDKNGAVWLYGVAGGKTGYCHIDYLS